MILETCQSTSDGRHKTFFLPINKISDDISFRVHFYGIVIDCFSIVQLFFCGFLLFCTFVHCLSNSVLFSMCLCV